MKKLQCKVCDYVYDPEIGDPETGVPPDTTFGDLPEHWRCPVCGATKDEFAARGGEGAVRHYSRPGLTVVWRSALCNHNGNCTRRLPEVFSLERRPWVNVQGAGIDEIRQVVNECPTGALTHRTDDA